MAGAVAFTISAVDDASAKFEAINKQVAAIGAPVEKLQKSFGRLSDASGITKLSKGFGDLARGSLDAFRNITRVVDPLAAITGAASIAGMVKLTESWAQFGSQLGFTAQRLGMAAGTLQTLQGAARLAGASSSSLAAGLETLGQNLWNAEGGRDPAMVATLQTLGFSMADIRAKGDNVTAWLPQLANKIAAIKDPFAQATVATDLFGAAGVELLPFLRLGAAGIAQYSAEMQRYGVLNAAGVAGANNMRLAQARLTLAVEGLGNSVAQQLAPVLDPLLGQMSEWIARNREWIATGIAGAVQQFATYLQAINWQQVGQRIEQIGASINGVVKHLGGWQTVAEGLLVFMAGTWLAGMLAPFVTLAASIAGISASIVSLPVLAAVAAAATLVALKPSTPDAANPTAQGYYVQQGARQIWVPTSNQIENGIGGHYVQQGDRRIWQPNVTAAQQAMVRNQGLSYFEGQGWSPAQAAGIVGNIQAESSYNPGARNGDMAGLFQWSPARAAAILKGTGIDVYTATAMQQFQAAQWELMNPEKNAAAALRSTSTPDGAAITFDNGFERSGDNPAQQQSRGANALYIASLPPQPSGPAVNVASGGGNTQADHHGAGAGGTLRVEVAHTNAPAGTSVRVSSNNPTVKVSSLKVSHAMVGHA